MAAAADGRCDESILSHLAFKKVENLLKILGRIDQMMYLQWGVRSTNSKLVLQKVKGQTVQGQTIQEF